MLRGEIARFRLVLDQSQEQGPGAVSRRRHGDPAAVLSLVEPEGPPDPGLARPGRVEQGLHLDGPGDRIAALPRPERVRERGLDVRPPRHPVGIEENDPRPRLLADPAHRGEQRRGVVDRHRCVPDTNRHHQITRTGGAKPAAAPPPRPRPARGPSPRRAGRRPGPRSRGR